MVFIAFGEKSDQAHYEDTGCEASGQCLECPLPQCRHDDPGGWLRWKRQRKDRAVIDAINREGLYAEEAAGLFGVTVRTIYRIKRRVRLGKESTFATEVKHAGLGEAG